VKQLHALAVCLKNSHFEKKCFCLKAQFQSFRQSDDSFAISSSILDETFIVVHGFEASQVIGKESEIVFIVK